MPRKIIDMTGWHFGKVTVVGFAVTGAENGPKRARWDILCDCGVEKSTTGSSLRAGLVQSCGCMRGVQQKTKPRKRVSAIYRPHIKVRQRRR